MNSAQQRSRRETKQLNFTVSIIMFEDLIKISGVLKILGYLR